MSMKRLNRPGLEDYMRANYGKVKNAEIAARFHVTTQYLRNLAKRMGLSRKYNAPDNFVNSEGYPKGYSKQDFVANTPAGKLLRKGNLVRHVMR